MAYMSDEESAVAMVGLVLAGDSCDTCLYFNDPYGDCPFEPDARHSKPVLNGVTLCQRHSAGPAPGTGGRGRPGRS